VLPASLVYLQFQKPSYFVRSIFTRSGIYYDNIVWAVWYFSTWYLSFVLSRNAVSQKSHLNGFSPVWIKLCLRRLDPRLNTFEQSRHGNDFPLLAVVSSWRICNFKNLQILSKADDSIKSVSVFSWIFIACLLKEALSLKRVPQRSQWNGWTPV